jgi:enoyl-CoA hydratase
MVSQAASSATVSNSSSNAALALANVQYEKKGLIAYVTVNRPKVLNALNTPTWTDLQTAFKDAKADASVRGVILTGAGDKAFIAGADISELAHIDAYEAEESSRFGQGVLDLIENLGKPVIAAINGFALGGGCETAMACTMRIAAEHAKFGQPEVKLGLLPGGGGTQRLPRLVGKGRALQLILTGETISAQEAYRIGLVNEVVSAANLIARAETIGSSALNGTTPQSMAVGLIWRSPNSASYRPSASIVGFPTNKPWSRKSPLGSTTAMPTTPRQTGTSQPPMLVSNSSTFTLQSD